MKELKSHFATSFLQLATDYNFITILWCNIQSSRNNANTGNDSDKNRCSE